MGQKDKETDLHKIKKLIDIMKDNDLVEIEIKHGDDKILLKRFQPQQPVVTAMPIPNPNVPAAPAAAGANAEKTSEIEAGPSASNADDDLGQIKSPIVGTFYEAPSPDSAPYVEIGSQVSSQTVICIIEAMKVMNEIKAETNGTIVERLVTNGQAVEYGQVLFKIKPE